MRSGSVSNRLYVADNPPHLGLVNHSVSEWSCVASPTGDLREALSAFTRQPQMLDPRGLPYDGRKHIVNQQEKQNMAIVTHNQILRLKEVSGLTGLRRSTLYNRISANSFPKQFPLGGRAVGWLASEVEAWINQVAASRNLGNGLVQQ